MRYMVKNKIPFFTGTQISNYSTADTDSGSQHNDAGQSSTFVL